MRRNYLASDVLEVQCSVGCSNKKPVLQHRWSKHCVQLCFSRGGSVFIFFLKKKEQHPQIFLLATAQSAPQLDSLHQKPPTSPSPYLLLLSLTLCFKANQILCKKKKKPKQNTFHSPPLQTIHKHTRSANQKKIQKTKITYI